MGTARIARRRHAGQLGMAERLAGRHGDELMFAHGVGWHEWDRKRWQLCEDGAPVRYAVAELARMRADMPDDKGKRREHERELGRLETHSGITGVLSLLASLRPVAVAGRLLDADPHLFNAENCTVNLETGGRWPAAPRDRITKSAGAPLDLDATSDVFDAFLVTVLPDEEVRSYVQRIFGMALLGEVRDHVLPIFTGTGANGKGTLRDAVNHAFGDYARELDPELMMAKKSEVHSTEMTDLMGLRLVTMSETEKGRRLSEAVMKRLVGGDDITARKMRQDTVTFKPTWTIVMLTNYLPDASSDPAVWRRVRVVPFTAKIPRAQQDGRLPAKLRAAGPAVLAWVYRGWLDYAAGGLREPAKVRSATSAYRADSDHLGEFLSERTTEGETLTVAARELFDAWARWCRVTGEAPGTEAEMAKAMTQRGYERIRLTRGYRWTGLAVLPDEEEPPPP